MTLDDNGLGTVTITETLPSYMVFANTGAGDALGFNLLDPTDPTLVVNVTSAGFTYEGAGTYHDDGTGSFTNAVDCTSCGSGTSVPQYTGPLVFTITSSTGISISDFTTNGNGNYFTADLGSVLTGGTGNTGDIAGNLVECTSGTDCGGGGGPQSLSPEPLSLWLTGAGLMALGFVRKRSKV